MIVDGEAKEAACTGDGPVDAVFNAIHQIVPHEAALRLFQVHAVTEGTDAQAQVSVRLEDGGHIATGHAADTDTLTAAAKAYVNALNNLLQRREKTAPRTAHRQRVLNPSASRPPGASGGGGVPEGCEGAVPSPSAPLSRAPPHPALPPARGKHA